MNDRYASGGRGLGKQWPRCWIAGRSRKLCISGFRLRRVTNITSNIIPPEIPGKYVPSI